jgi:dihydroorotase-like cyclic amidohydrolase
LCSTGPAKRFGFYPRKGAVAIGSDADLVLVDTGKEITISSKDQRSRAGFTPFDGWKVRGIPVTTIVRGEMVMHQGEIMVEPGFGQYTRALHE